MKNILLNINSCTLCKHDLPLKPLPILQVSKFSKILIAGQAPGIITHNKGVPFLDKSGDRLREWLGVTKEQFYDPEMFAILPMGFCYPGKGKTGDLPPLPICAITWRQQLLNQLNKVELTIVIGKYAIEWHLQTKAAITAIAKDWQNSLAKNYIVLPHPSPRNNIWLKKNDWLEKEVIPILKQKVNDIINN